MSDIPLYVYTTLCLSFFSVDRLHPCLVIMNYATINFGLQVSVGVPAFSSFGYIPRSEIAGPYNNSLFFEKFSMYFL
jgi:hypothetical protein